MATVASQIGTKPAGIKVAADPEQRITNGVTTTPQCNGDSTTDGHVALKAPKFQYAKQYMGKKRPFRIIVVGAGISGIAAVKLFKERFNLPGDDPDSKVELVIYEKNDDVTGTWLENRYPGCACDVPAHAYTYSWEGNPYWTRAYVGARELFDYFKGRAVAYGVSDFVWLRHRVHAATWDSEAAVWRVDVEDLATQEKIQDSADLLINAAGFLNNWRWPDIPGLSEFEGKLLHSAHWDADYDFKDKVVGVIGSGSSAIQIVPQLQPIVKHLTSFNRSKTWITPEFAAEFAPEGRSSYFFEEQKNAWSTDKDDFLAYRKKVESTMNKFFDMQFKDSPLQREAFENFGKTMRTRLSERDNLITAIVPEFPVGCRRVTPGHGYLEALAADNATVRSDSIARIRPNGVEMADGSILEMDVIVCATGFDTSFRPFFPVIGLGGRDLRDQWSEEPRSYLSVAAYGFPNYIITSGPNFPLANGALIPALEENVKYAFEFVEKLRHDRIKSMHPKQGAVDDFQEYKDALMEDLVWSANCSSWYKNGKPDGKVWGPWPGSSLHYLELMSSPRWEDYNIEYLNENRFHFLGNGKSRVETQEGGDLAWYLREPGAKNTAKKSGNH